MTKRKSMFVTALVGGMTLAIVFGLYGLHHQTFMVLVCVFAAVGFAFSCGAFCAWLGKGSAMEPVVARHLPIVPAEPEETVDDIIREMRGESMAEEEQA